MKKITLFALLAFTIICLKAQNDSAIFLHHSTGGGVWSEGNVSFWIDDFNSGNSTNYYAQEFSYPNTPWPWNNYPYDYWKLWVDGSCNNNKLNIACIDYFAERYELIILKHCFPGAGIGEDSGNPDVTSSNKTLGNYKAQYRALRQMMDAMPNTKFMFWTLAPLHRLATNADDATRAHQFVEWVKNDFLTEDSKPHPNIYIFDFYGLVAELNANPVKGQQYCLKFDYEGDSINKDSHPNKTANEYVGPFFGRAILNALGNTIPIVIDANKSVSADNSELISVFPNPGSGIFRLTINNKLSAPYEIQLIATDGRIIWDFASEVPENEMNLSGLSKGMYLVRVQTGEQTILERLIIQ
jgi:hypothetical protein